MKKQIVLSVIFLTLILSSCSLKIRTASYGSYQPQNEVVVIQSGQPLPKDAIRIGSIETSDRGFTPTRRCTYAASIDAIVKKAKKMGGNIVYIVSVKEPSVWEVHAIMLQLMSIFRKTKTNHKSYFSFCNIIV